eukprot:6334121-Pyramimonas_sp.AAC.2
MPPADVPLGGDVWKVAAGYRHNCAVLVGGAVKCWGYNEYGQLGYGHTRNIGADPADMPPADVPIGGPAFQVTA